MATGPRDKQRWTKTNSSSSMTVHSKRILNKSHNPSDISQPQQFSIDENNSSRPPPKSLDTVASNDSSSHNRVRPVTHNSSNGTGNSPPGYVKFDNKVRISLNTGSKSVIRELKRKLVSELDQVRSLKRKLEATDIHYNGFNDTEMMMGNGGGSYTNRVGTLARVNSEISYVGPSNSRPLKGLAVSVDDNSNHYDYGSVGEKVDKEKKTSKVNQLHKNPDSGIGKKKILGSDNKKLKPGIGGKKGSGGQVMEFESGMGMNSREMFKKCGSMLEKLMKHQYGWVFNKPVDVKKLNLHDYYRIIKHPMDLGTVNSRLKKNWYKSPKEFAEDVRLTFNNAMTYNEKGQDVHIMADVLLKLFEEKWTSIKAEYNFDESFDVGHDTSLPALTSKRTSATPARAPAPTSAPPPLKMPLETRTLDRPGSVTKAMHSNMKDTKIATDESKKEMSKKPKEKGPQRREMTFEEKQILSTNLMSLPSEKLDSVVQIIRKRNPGLCLQEDEIEVDIDSFDSETLWELDRLVTNHMMDSSKNKRKGAPMLQTRDQMGHNIQETNVTSTAAETIEESEAVEKNINRSPTVREQEDKVSRSSNSGSSSGDSGSSSSDSDSNSSSQYCSDTGR